MCAATMYDGIGKSREEAFDYIGPEKMMEWIEWVRMDMQQHLIYLAGVMGKSTMSLLKEEDMDAFVALRDAERRKEVRRNEYL